MARPPKQTVDYFSHDADASDGRTITILENHFGADGYMAWFKLLERLARVKNHIIDLRNHDSTEYLAAKMRLPPDRFTQILDKMADLDAIDKELYSQKIIWCQNFVDRLKDVYDNRKQHLPYKPSISTIDNHVLIPTPTPANLVIEDTVTPEIPQSKLKYSTVNNIIKGDVKKTSLIGEKTKEVFAKLDKERGYRPPKRKAEAVSIIRMLKMDFTPDQIIKCWQTLKSDDFWKGKELYMMSVEAQIAAMVKDGVLNKKPQKPMSSMPYRVVQ